MTNDELRRAVYKIDAALSALRKAQYARFQTEDCQKKQNTIISVNNDEATAIAWGLERYIKEYAVGEDDEGGIKND